MRLAIFCALRWECRPVLQALPHVQRSRIGRWPAWSAHTAAAELLVVQTGVGLQRAGDAAAAVLDGANYDLVLSTGCAGALAPDLFPGDLVIASSIVGSERSLPADAEFQERAVAICSANRLRFQRGAILTSPTVLTTVAARRAAVVVSSAIAVEMETAAIARAAAERGVAIGEVRAVLDSADVELHESGDFMDPETGRLRPLDVLRFVATHPSAAAHLLALRRMMTSAEQALARFFREYVRDSRGY